MILNNVLIAVDEESITSTHQYRFITQTSTKHNIQFVNLTLVSLKSLSNTSQQWCKRIKVNIAFV